MSSWLNSYTSLAKPPVNVGFCDCGQASLSLQLNYSLGSGNTHFQECSLWKCIDSLLMTMFKFILQASLNCSDMLSSVCLFYHCDYHYNFVYKSKVKVTDSIKLTVVFFVTLLSRRLGSIKKTTKADYKGELINGGCTDSAKVPIAIGLTASTRKFIKQNFLLIIISTGAVSAFRRFRLFPI